MTNNRSQYQKSRLNISLRPSVRHQADQLAAERSTTITNLINEILERVLSAEMQKPALDP